MRSQEPRGCIPGGMNRILWGIAFSTERCIPDGMQGKERDNVVVCARFLPTSCPYGTNRYLTPDSGDLRLET